MNDPRENVSQTFLGKTQPELQTPGGGIPTDTSRLERGSTVGRYHILEPLGEGGMGCVYAAYDPSLDRRIALKLLKPDVSAAAPEEARQRLLREAQAMARLNHPNVITVHDVGAMNDQVFVAMEMVKGGTLRDWLKEAPRGPREVLAQYALAGEGLSAAHSAGLVHRDFKPDNVLVGSDGRVRVTDFGLARSSGAEVLLHTRPAVLQSVKMPLEPITHEGAVMGTPAYMAPEQLLGRPTDARTDQFSFAVALYEALFGSRPFEGGTLAELSASIAKGQVKPAPPGSRTWMREPLLKALKANPLERWPSMRELLDALAKDPRIARRRWLYAATAAVLVGAAGTTAKVITDREEARCDAKGSLSGVWDDGRREASRAAFEKSGAPGAGHTFELAAAQLDALAQTWSREEVALCRRERTLKAADATVLAQCMQRRRDELVSLGGVFAEADRLVVDTAMALVTRRDATECVAVKASAAAPEIAVPAELRSRLEHARMLAQSGRHEALGQLEQVLAEARALGNRRFVAETLWRLSVAYDGQNDARALETFRSAELAAEAAGDDELLANVRLDFTSSLGFHFSQIADAEREAGSARATLDRIGGNERLEALYMSKLADLRGLEGKYDEALPLGRKALELYTKISGPTAPDTLDAEGLLINVLINAGQYDEAIPRADHLVEATAKMLGPEHRVTGSSLTTKGLALVWAGRYEEARVAFQRAVEIDERNDGPDGAGAWLNLSNLAEVLQHLGRHPEALALYERAHRLILKHNPDDSQAMAEVLAGLGRSRLASSEPEKAVPLFEQALKLREQRPGERANLAENELSLADALWQTKRDRPRALGLAKSARMIYTEGGEGDAKAVARVDEWLQAHH